MPVVTAALVPTESYQVSTRYPGRIEARRAVDLGFEQGGTIARVQVEEGDRVAAGAILADLDTRALEADREARIAARDSLRAQADLAQLTADRQKALLDRDHVSRQRYDEARLAVARLEADIRAAEAGIAALDVALDKAVLRAPFAAIVGARHADDGTRVASGQPVIALFEDTAPQFRAGLPPALARTLRKGDAARVDIDGIGYDARVLHVRDDVDPATRTHAVILTLPDLAAAPDGALGSLALVRDVAEAGAWVPATALVEGVRGLWTLYLVDADGERPLARREAVELIYSDGERAYVRGAFERGATVIAAGPHRVANGQPVAVDTGD